MAAQTSYTSSPVAGIPGMLYDSGILVDTWSCTYGSATLCSPGDFVCRLAADASTVELPDSAGDVTTAFGGFVIFQPHRIAGTQIQRYESISILRKGRIWLTSIDAITADAPVYIRRDGTNNGKVYAGSTGASLLPGIKCIIGAGAGAVGLFEVDLTQT